MLTETTIEVIKQPNADDELNHDTCYKCWPNVYEAQYAVCGEYMGGSSVTWIDPATDPNYCPFCLHTDVCPVCGAEFQSNFPESAF